MLFRSLARDIVSERALGGASRTQRHLGFMGHILARPNGELHSVLAHQGVRNLGQATFRRGRCQLLEGEASCTSLDSGIRVVDEWTIIAILTETELQGCLGVAETLRDHNDFDKGVMMMNGMVRLSALCSVLLVTTSTFAADVVVNGMPLEEPAHKSLEHKYGVPIKPGRYWYDNVSGVWGREGGPGVGQIDAGLRLGGPLRRDASKGHTGVIVNGRELHALDVASLQRCLVVVPGSYWVLANGVGGLAGGPPQFNLTALCGGGSLGGSSTKCEDYGGGRFNCSNQRTGIGMIGEGGGQGGVFIDGKVIMTPN